MATILSWHRIRLQSGGWGNLVYNACNALVCDGGGCKVAIAAAGKAATMPTKGPVMANVTHTPKYEVVFFDLYGTLIDIRTDEQCDAA